MKKLIILGSFIAIIIACNSGDTSETKTTTNANETAAATAPADPEVAMGLELIAKSDCLTCHKLNEDLIGPSYKAVAAKYENNQQVIDSISKKIITGGAGTWGSVPMTAHPALSEEDAKKMMKYILSLK